MKSKAMFGQMQPGDWMVGGSRDDVGERMFGFGPQTAAQVASLAYGVAAEECRRLPRERFVKSLCALFEQGLREAIREERSA